jgi:hypothetical protein
VFTKAGKTRSTMSLRTKLIMLAAGAAASLALMTTAAPAMAQEYPSPEGSSSEQITLPPPEDALDVSSAAFGVLAGISLAAAGLGITIGVQRRRDHRAVPTV